VPKIQFTFSYLNFSRTHINNNLLVDLFSQETKSNRNSEESTFLSIDTIINCENILDKKPNSQLAYSLIGVALENLFLEDEAKEAFNNAIKTTTDSQLTADNLNRMNAIKQKSVNLSVKATNYGYLADGYLSLGKAEKASVYYEKALILNPNNANFYNNLSIAYFQLGLWDKAIFASQEGLRLNPNLDSAKNVLEQSKIKVSQTNINNK
jgi:tetratricopeptide (TPR) repeat protein